MKAVRIGISLLVAAYLTACGGGGDGGSTGSSLIGPGSATSQAVTSSVSLQWTAPVARADNMPLSPAEIAGYRVYYGPAEGDYRYSIDINDGTAEDLTLNNLPLGAYYFVVTTYDTGGRESAYSAVVKKTI